MTEKTKVTPPIVTPDCDELSDRTIQYFEERIKLGQLMLEFRKATYETDALVYAALIRLNAISRSLHWLEPICRNTVHWMKVSLVNSSNGLTHIHYSVMKTFKKPVAHKAMRDCLILAT